MDVIDSTAILERVAAGYARPIDLTLRPAYFELLKKLGDPHKNMPPVIHVAGTNGKGSTCAFLRSILEAAGHKVHVYTSPHLVRFHERIRIAGRLIEESELVKLLLEAESHLEPGTVSYFEFGTAAAMMAFARNPADFVILETGLGGRQDATNIVPKPIATCISRISFDHREFLGDTLESIAAEKAGIMKPNVPCLVGRQTAAQVMQTFTRTAHEQQTSLLCYGRDWRVDPAGSKFFRYSDSLGFLELPYPELIGVHQLDNASLAIATLRLGAKLDITPRHYAEAMKKVEWPARLQKLKRGELADILPSNWELWLDGGHNDSAGEILAQQAEAWRSEDGAKPKPLFVIYGMMRTKNPLEFLQPFASAITGLRAIAIPGETKCLPVQEGIAAAAEAGIKDSAPAVDLKQAVLSLTQSYAKPARLLICGSLYLAGHVLTDHG